MPEGDGSTVDVEFGVVEVQQLQTNQHKKKKSENQTKRKRKKKSTDVHVGQSDDTEGFVDLPEVDLVSSDTSVLEGAGDSIRRGGGELDGRLLSITVPFSIQNILSVFVDVVVDAV